MEVSGKSAPPSEDNSHNSHLICLPCDRDGLKESVYGFCQDCQEHLCETCFKHHKRPRPLRNHVLLDRDEMPKHQTIDPVRPDGSSDFCGNHKDKTLEFYCTTHRVVACYVCITLEHKHCKVDYIPDISGQVSDEFRKLIAQMESLIKKCKTNIENAETATEKLYLNHRKVIEDIKLLRGEINDYLDQMEAEITQESEVLVNTVKCKENNVKAASVEVAEEVSCSQTFLNYLSDENQHNKLFIEMKKAEERLSDLTSKEKQILQDNKTEHYIEFIRNKNIIDLLKSENNFGTLTLNGKPSADKTLCLEYDGTVSVKSASDKKACEVSGLVLISSKKLIVADKRNRRIKLFDVENGSVISESILSSSPSDVISLPQNKLAVTLRSEKCIQILTVSSTSISSDRRLAVGESCNGVAYCQGKLVVACNICPGKIVIMNLAGDLVKVFDSPSLFKGPEKIAISSDEKFLYVSDHFFWRNKCIQMNWQGNAVNAFQKPEYRQPFGIQELEDGTLLVCYSESDTIVRLSGSCKKREIKGLEKEKLYRPHDLAYCDRNHKLYVSCASKGLHGSDTIKVFKVKWT